MKTSFLETLWVIGVTLALLVTPTAARAEPSRNAATTTELGIEPGTDFQIAPLEAPSAAHPWGTVALAWNEADSAGMDRLCVGAWDLRAGRLVNVRTLREQGADDRALRLVRDGESLLVLSSGFFAPGGATELIRLGLDLVEQGSVAFADGFLGSLVADGRFIAVGTYEGDGYHVRLLDAATLVVLAARKFHEDHALTPWPAQERSSHALRLGSGALYVALAERDPRFVKLRLPSLAPEATLVFPTPNAHRTLSTSAALSAPPAPLSFDTGADRYLLSGDLRLLAPLPATAVPREDESSSEMMGERVSQRMFGRTVSTAVRNERWVLRVAP